MTRMFGWIDRWLVTKYKCGSGAKFMSLSYFIHAVVSINNNRLCDRQYYSRTPLIRINWEGEPSGYAENPDNWICL